jgi:hypothetical protein
VIVSGFGPLSVKGIAKKLAKLWTGPWYIKEVLSDLNMHLERAEGKPMKYPVHVARLKPFFSCEEPADDPILPANVQLESDADWSFEMKEGPSYNCGLSICDI